MRELIYCPSSGVSPNERADVNMAERAPSVPKVQIATASPPVETAFSFNFVLISSFFDASESTSTVYTVTFVIL